MLSISEVLCGCEDFLQKFVLVHGPVFAGEDFDFCEAGEVGGADHFEDTRGGVYAFAGEASI